MKKIILVAFSFLLLCAATEKMNLVEMLNSGLLEEGDMIFWNEDPLSYATIEKVENEDGSEDIKLLTDGKYYTITELADLFSLEKNAEDPYKLFRKDDGKTLDELIKNKTQVDSQELPDSNIE